MMDEQALMDFVHKAVGDVGSMLAGSMVVIGDRLGLYRAMTGTGPVTSDELARATGTSERYVREWLSAQAAAGYVRYADPDRRIATGKKTHTGKAARRAASEQEPGQEEPGDALIAATQ